MSANEDDLPPLGLFELLPVIGMLLGLNAHLYKLRFRTLRLYMCRVDPLSLLIQVICCAGILIAIMYGCGCLGGAPTDNRLAPGSGSRCFVKDPQVKFVLS